MSKLLHLSSCPASTSQTKMRLKRLTGAPLYRKCLVVYTTITSTATKSKCTVEQPPGATFFEILATSPSSFFFPASRPASPVPGPLSDDRDRRVAFFPHELAHHP